MIRLDVSSNKYHARRTWSELCHRFFASRAEATHGEQLRMLEMAGAISHLEYQVPFVLCKQPKITITIDFRYIIATDEGTHHYVLEDVKGVLTREFRVKLAWLKEREGYEVQLIR